MNQKKETITLTREKDTDQWYAVNKLGNSIMTALSLDSEWSEADCYCYMKQFLLYPKKYEQCGSEGCSLQSVRD